MNFYTIKGKTDGFGAQYQAIMSGIAFCVYKKYIYIHTDFIEMEHDGDINKLNLFIGINNNHLINKNYTIEKIIVEPYSQLVHYSNTPSIYYTENVINILRTFYYSTKKPCIDNIDIAIHIRRGDVDKIMSERFTSNNIYYQIIKSLKLKYPNYNIIIFSEGKYEDFKDFELDEKHFKLNTDIEETFHSLVKAKVLVMAKSSFSYSAAILNSNIIYYQDFWHKPLENWLDISLLFF
jgi:hypothetical protein